MKDYPLKLNLSKELREEVERYILRNVQETVTAHATRNSDLYRWRDMRHGIPNAFAASAWQNACQIEDGLLQEQINQLLAPMLKPLSSYPLATVDETDKASAEKAQAIEQWIAQVMQRRGFSDSFSLFADSAVCYPWGVHRTEWIQTERRKRAFLFWDGESVDDEGNPVLLNASERDPDGDYQEVPVLEPDGEEGGIEFACVAPWDFYLSPPDAPCVSAADAVMEHRRYTENDLLNGIADYGFDEEAVKEAIRYCGGDSTDEERERYRVTWGIEASPATFSNGECYVWYGYLPKLYDSEGEPRLPEYLWNDLFCAVVYPKANRVLKLDFSPYTEYPYDTGTLLPEAGSPYGMGLGPMLESDQQEATHYRRVAANTADMIASPPIVMYNNAWELNKNQTLYPGSIFRGETKGDIEFASFPTAPNVVSVQMLDYTRNRAQAKSAAQGFGQVNAKQPLVAEMEGVLAATDVKFDLFQRNIYSIVPKVARRILTLYAQFQPGFQTNLLMEGEEVPIDAESLAGQYEFSVASSNQNASEQARIQRDAAILKIQNDYFTHIGNTFGTPLAFTQPAKWTACRDALSHMTVRKPERYLGTKPPEGGFAPPTPQLDPQAAIGAITGLLSGAQGQAGGSGAKPNPSPPLRAR